MRRALLAALNLGYRASLVGAASRFRRAARDPERAQQAALARVLRGARGTSFAKEHGLERVKSLDDFRAAVPIRAYDELEPWIERVKRGEKRVLTAEEPVAFEKSSGSTSASKYIPYTKAHLAELGAATSPWLAPLRARHPALRAGSAYWSISPIARAREVTPGGVKVGFEDDTEFFPPLVRRALRVLLPVPPSVARLPDIESCRHETLRHLLADEHLALFSVWNPSFLVLLLEHAREHAAALVADLERTDTKRARTVRAALEGGLDLERLWPNLAVVSCWTDAAAALALPALKRLLPAKVAIEGKGLMAAEGVVSIPIGGPVAGSGAVLAVASHLLELLPDEPGATPIAPHEAALGRRYRPLLTTGGGLYRYDLGDVIEVVGWFQRTPRVRFVGRADGVSDLRGEKLSPAHVGSVLEAVFKAEGIEPDFAMVAPVPGEPPGYTLFTAVPLRSSTNFDLLLRQNHGYDHARRLGQLRELQVVAVKDGARRFERALVARGMKAGDVKPASLHPGLFWSEVFA